MVFNTATVSTAVTPVVIQRFFEHYLNRKPRAQKPTAHISYDEGLALIRKFLLYASHHTVEDIQRFTAQWVPHPTWVKVDEVIIAQEYITKAAEAIQEQLGHHGVEKVGGKTWWQWRRPASELKAEWIEMRADHNERKKKGDEGKRVMLYVHGGAYFFGSVDEHRYQMQRHARKLKARVFAPRYRLAPQFPFPCGLHDCLSAYMFLLTVQDPTTIVLAGDSAGGGMVLSMLVCMRDHGIPLPAGAILISPWVDLTHSFPSVSGDNPLDYIPPHGFHQRPSPSWPPPNADDMLAIEEAIVKKLAHKDHIRQPKQPETEEDAVEGFHVNENPAPGTKNENADNGTATQDGSGQNAKTIPGAGHELSIMIDGKLVEIKDQLQMYCTNQLMAHPLVSPNLQPTLGGLPPLLILTGGGEMLRDEQIYLAHKAANPPKYPPGDAFLDDSPHDHNRNQVNRWKPTDVQLQVWEDLCHVAPTLSFTRPAKYMYRSIAQFGAWALARAQKTEIEILIDDDVSVISHSGSDVEEEEATEKAKKESPTGIVGKAGDPLPPFKKHMIRQRVDRHGIISELEHESQLPGCTLDPSQIGIIKEGPVRKWMAAKREWDTKFASTKRGVQKKRAKEMAEGYQTFEHGEVPPPSALAGRRRPGEDLREQRKKRSMGMSLWALWGSKHDEKTMDREQEADKDGGPETAVVSSADGAGARPAGDSNKTTQGHLMDKAKKLEYSRSRSRRRTVTDQHQTESEDVDENTPTSELLALKNAHLDKPSNSHPTPAFAAGAFAAVAGAGAAAYATEDSSSTPAILARSPTNDITNSNSAGDDLEAKRPKAGGIAFPFTVKGHQSTASMTTLTSDNGVSPAEDVRTPDAMVDGRYPKEGVVGEVEEGRIGPNAFENSGLMGGSVVAMEKGKEIVNGTGNSDGKAIGLSVLESTGVVGAGGLVNGGEIASERPPLETFSTAFENLPTTSTV